MVRSVLYVRCMTIRTVVAVAALVAACSAEDGIPEGHGQLEAHVDGDPIAPYHTYHFFVLDPATNELLYGDELAVDQIVMPVDSRFVTALPANRPLLVGVYATDADSIVVGAGSVVIALAPKQKTSVQIEVLAHAAGQSGSLDAQLSDAQLPSRVAFASSPSTNQPGGTQELFGKLADATSGTPITDAVAVDIDSAVAPMFLVENGGVTTQFVWSKSVAYPVTAKARIAYLDADGRGWVGSATTTFTAPEDSVVIDAAWTGQIHASGTLANGGRWLFGPFEDASSAGIAVYADANGDGTYQAAEIVTHPTSIDPLFLAWTAPTPIELKTPAATVVAGALVGGKAGFDTFLAIDVDGEVHITPWPNAK